MKVLVTRTDRLGDVVLSLPVFTYIKRRRPDWEVHALVARGSAPLVENDPHIDAIWTDTELASAKLADLLAREKFDAVLLLLYVREVAALCKRIGIPRRYGPWSKLSSWWYLNRGLRQARSRVEYHELEYNLQLASKLTGDKFTGAQLTGDQLTGAPGALPEPRIELTEMQRELGRRFRLDETVGEDQAIVFIHPGSGGSALDWEPERFATVANRLAAEPDQRVYVTGSHHDRLFLDRLAPLLDPTVKVLAERYQLREFLGVLSAGDLLIGPSTGPLHMAAALGLATVGLFPPVSTMSPRRWGARGAYSRAVVPELTCPAKKYCIGERCLFYNCMQGLSVETVFAAARELLRECRAAKQARRDES